MEQTWKERTGLVLGEDGMARLERAHVAVFGLGGVGSACAEALVRAGVGSLTLFDADRVNESNLNRQLIALRSTVGMEKTEACRRRYLDINLALRLTLHTVFYDGRTAADYPLDGYSFVVDAIDTVSSKLLIIENARRAGVPVISCMGTGNKLRPDLLEAADISKTTVCPLARVMRRELRKRGIAHLPVVYSREEPLRAVADDRHGRHAPGSISFVPPAAGYLLASRVVLTLCAGEGNDLAD